MKFLQEFLLVISEETDKESSIVTFFIDVYIYIRHCSPKEQNENFQSVELE